MTKTARRGGLQPHDIGALHQAEDPRLSPDGSLVAYVVGDVELQENRYRRRIFLASAAEDPNAAWQFTTGPRDRLPRWSPDGALLAFVADHEDGPAELCVLPVRHGGERAVVTRLAVGPSELEWSPDGTRLAFVARDPDPGQYGKVGETRKPKDMPSRRVTTLFSRLNGEGFIVDRPNRVMVVPADGSEPPLRLTAGPFQARGLSWSPDGTAIAFASGRHGTWDLDLAVDLYSVRADGSAEPERLTASVAAYSFPSWSPDGAKIAYLVNPTPLDTPRHERLGVLDVAARTQTDVTGELDRNCGPYGSSRAPVWMGDRLLCQVEDAGNVHVYSFAVDGRDKPVPVVEGRRWMSGFDAATDTLAFVVSSPTTVSELVVRSIADLSSAAQERPVTDLTAPLRRRAHLGEPLEFVARSADGAEVPCWAIPPVGAVAGQRYPTLLNVHGGPFTSYGNRLFDEFQIQAGSGFGVLFCNPRGSSGYTEAWGRAIRWPGCESDPGSGWGGVDYEDVMACVDEAGSRFDWIDPGRLGVLGGSYGGYMTSWIIGHTGRFRAACSERACNDLLSLEYDSDIASAFRAYIGKTVLEDPEAYESRSPMAFVEHMTTPVLILHSEEDLRCPISQAEELFVALRLLGRDPVFVRFPGESHELSRSGAPKHRVERMEIILDWFRTHLG